MSVTQQKCAVGYRPSFSMDVLTTLLIILLFTPALHTTSEPRPCSPELSVEIIGGHLYPNESLLAPNGILYPKEQYWEEMSSDNASMVTRGCVCHFKNCIRKCCPEHHIYATSFEGTCLSKDHALLEPFSSNITDVTTAEEYADFHVLYEDPCKHGKYALDEVFEMYEISKNGTLNIYPLGTNGTNTSLSSELYCLEVYLQFEENQTEEHVVSITTFHCILPQEELPEQSKTFLIYPIGMLISEPFLLATFLVYAIIPELRNIHGKSLMSHVTCLFVSYLFLAIVQLGQSDISTSFCKVAAFIFLFFFLASFFWLNVMCFDLWWTCRTTSKHEDYKMFRDYSLYCWGISLIMIFVTIFMEFSAIVPDTFVKPQFGDGSCWFKTSVAAWAYLYGVVTVIMATNLVILIATAVKLKCLENQRSNDENGQRFSRCLKLFVIIGVNWSLSVLSTVTGDLLGILDNVQNIVMSFQGVLIFMVFGMRTEVQMLIVEKCKSLYKLIPQINK